MNDGMGRFDDERHKKVLFFSFLSFFLSFFLLTVHGSSSIIYSVSFYFSCCDVSVRLRFFFFFPDSGAVALG